MIVKGILIVTVIATELMLQLLKQILEGAYLKTPALMKHNATVILTVITTAMAQMQLDSR